MQTTILVVLASMHAVLKIWVCSYSVGKGFKIKEDKRDRTSERVLRVSQGQQFLGR